LVATAWLAAGLVQPEKVGAQEVAPEGASMPLLPGDGLQISFSMEPELNGLFFVDESGQVLLPILGSRSVGHLSAAELKEELIQEYDQQLRNQTVQINWLRRVRVFGAVNAPGLYHVDGTMSLADAIALAGGATPIGKLDGIQIIRAGQVVQDDLPATTLVEQQVRSGDQIMVPERSWASRYAGVIIGATLSALTLILVATLD
jgi:polysaccharide export outer membrane protein